MSALIKKFFVVISIITLPLSFATTTFAAAPDGNGPWADTVVTTAQGLRNDGSAVPSTRSDPTAALGVAEQTNAEGTFYSLGFGGSITLGFVNGISGGSMVFESTNLPYPTETAKVEFSENSTSWVNAGSVSRSGTVSQPEGVKCAKFVRITDTSDKAAFEPTADGYDVDGVKAQGASCTPTTPPPGNGCDCGCGANVTQTNTTTITNSITQNSNTGGNHSNNNTGGSINITTGNASNSATITNGGNTNSVTTGCCSGGGTSINVSNNGAGSTNTVTVTTGNPPPVTLSLIRRIPRRH